MSYYIKYKSNGNKIGPFENKDLAKRIISGGLTDQVCLIHATTNQELAVTRFRYENKEIFESLEGTPKTTEIEKTINITERQYPFLNLLIFLYYTLGAIILVFGIIKGLDMIDHYSDTTVFEGKMLIAISISSFLSLFFGASLMKLILNTANDIHAIRQKLSGRERILIDRK